MKNNEAIQLGPRRYIQGRGVLDFLGKEAAALGKHALVLAGRDVYPKVQKKIEASLLANGLSWEVFLFQGGCCPANYEAAASRGRASCCGLVIGIGGGRALDTAKIAADKMGVPVITVPTSAATCAATALLAVHYSNEGMFLGNYWPAYAPALCLTDLDVLIDNCPSRLNRAGIVDAMAKYPEIRYNILYTDNWQKNIMSHVAVQTAETTFRLLLEHGPSAMEKAERGEADGEVEDVIAAVLSITGFISCLAYGGKQAAVSHGLYSYFCNHVQELTGKFLHGELVGASLCYQMALDGRPEREAEELKGFLREMGCPASLKELGFVPDESERRAMRLHLQKILPAESEADIRRLEEWEPLLFG